MHEPKCSLTKHTHIHILLWPEFKLIKLSYIILHAFENANKFVRGHEFIQRAERPRAEDIRATNRPGLKHEAFKSRSQQARQCNFKTR